MDQILIDSLDILIVKRADSHFEYLIVFSSEHQSVT